MRQATYRTIRLALALVGAASAGAACSSSARDAELVASVRSAYLLERRVLDTRPSIDRRDQVVLVYRAGFGDSLAERFADLSWSPADRRVRPRGFAMEPPARVAVRDAGRRTAVVVFETPSAQRILWAERPFTVAELERGASGWRIIRLRSTDAPPPELREP